MATPTHPAPGFAPDLVVERLAEALALPGPVPVYGLTGLQGCGKSTLARQMADLAKTRGVDVAVLSIDDFYLGRRERQRLARSVHPLLATRGPPGTHDLPLALQTLASLRTGRPTPLPRFDKLADTRLPPSRWPRPPRPPALVLLEGWFLKTPPQSREQLREPVNALERDEDAHGEWRGWCNDALAAYAPLWREIDWLTLLQAPGFEPVAGWRWQQEQALQAARPGRPGMDRDQVRRFVQFFERTSRQALNTLPAVADRVLWLDAERRPVRSPRS